MVVPADEFHLNAPKARDLLVGSGPRFARDAFGPIVAFYVGWKLANLAVGIGLSTVIALLAYRHERRNERPGVMARVALSIVLVQAVVGLIADSERVYLAQPVLITAIYGTAFLVSTIIGRPLAATFAREMYPFPDEVRESRRSAPRSTASPSHGGAICSCAARFVWRCWRRAASRATSRSTSPPAYRS